MIALSFDIFFHYMVLNHMDFLLMNAESFYFVICSLAFVFPVNVLLLIVLDVLCFHGDLNQRWWDQHFSDSEYACFKCLWSPIAAITMSHSYCHTPTIFGYFPIISHQFRRISVIFTYFWPTSAFLAIYLYQDSSRSFSDHFQIFSDHFQPQNLGTIVDLDKILFYCLSPFLSFNP